MTRSSYTHIRIVSVQKWNRVAGISGKATASTWLGFFLMDVEIERRASFLIPSSIYENLNFSHLSYAIIIIHFFFLFFFTHTKSDIQLQVEKVFVSLFYKLINLFGGDLTPYFSLNVNELCLSKF